METLRIQTVLRLPPELMARVRRNARKQKRSFNSYVEHVLELATGPDFPVLPPKYEVSGEIRDLHRIAYKVPTAQELAGDPRLAYLWEKYGRD